MPPPPSCRTRSASCMTVDGGRLALGKAELAGGTVQARHASRHRAISIPLEAVLRIDFSSGKIAYLSDLNPESATRTCRTWGLPRSHRPCKISIATSATRLRAESVALGRQDLSQGPVVGTAARVLVYKLPGKFRLFQCVMGIDDSVRETGDVHVSIKGDGKTLWEGEVRGSRPGSRVGARSCRASSGWNLLVDYGGGLDIGDRLDLCEARVTK